MTLLIIHIINILIILVISKLRLRHVQGLKGHVLLQAAVRKLDCGRYSMVWFGMVWCGMV